MTWLEQHWVNLANFLFGGILAGIVVSWYFYHLAKRERQPVFLVDAVRTEIVNTGRIAEAPIRVLRRDNGREITSNVTVFRFYLWNAGKEAIKRENILEGIRLVLENAGANAEILEPRILKRSRENIIEFSLERNVENPKTMLDVDFRILEQRDGVTGQIMYIGDPKATLKIVGAIEGASLATGRKREWLYVWSTFLFAPLETSPSNYVAAVLTLISFYFVYPLVADFLGIPLISGLLAFLIKPDVSINTFMLIFLSMIILGWIVITGIVSYMHSPWLNRFTAPRSILP